MTPIDYGIQGAPDPSQQFMAALGQGMQLNALRQKQAEQERQRQAALIAQQRVDSVLTNPNASHEDLIGVLQYMDPKVSNEVLKAREAADKSKAQAALGHGMQVIAALRNGAPDAAVQLLNERAEALKNSGRPQEAAKFAEMAKRAEADPIGTANLIGVSVAGLPGAKEAFDALSTQGTERRADELFPAAKRKATADAAGAEADATTKGVTAKYAESQALADLETKGWNVRALQADIEFKKQSTRIAAMNAALAREGNELKRQELRLKVDEAVTKRDDRVREKVATAEAGAASIDNMLNTIERIKKNPDLNDVLGSIEGRLPSVFSDAGSDAIALIETLGSQAFLAQIPNIKGMGALSNAEGEKLQSALQNLGRTQSETQFRANLAEASRLLNKGRESLSKSTGVPLGKPDTPAAPGARPPLDSFMKGG